MKPRQWMAAPLVLGALASPVQAEPGLEKARALAAADQFPAAVEAYRAALAKDGGNLAAWRELGSCLDRAGKEAEALQVWNNLLCLAPGDVATLNAFAEDRLARKDYAAAIARFSQSLRCNPGQPGIQMRLGEACEGAGLWDQAIQHYEDRLKREPGNVDALLHRARVDEQRGEFRKPIDRLEAVLREAPGLKGALAPRLAHLQDCLGGQAYAKGDFAQARQAYQTGLRWEERNPRLLTGLGWALRMAGDPSLALATWERAMAVTGGATPELLRAAADAGFELARYPEALALLLRARALTPREPAISLKLAELGFQTGDRALQADALQTLLAVPGQEPQWAERAAELFIRFEQVDRGLVCFQALPADSGGRGHGLSRLYATLAGREYRAEHNEAAIVLYQSAAAANPGNLTVLRDLGWAQAKAGDWQAAATIWGRYAALAPSSAEAHGLVGEGLLGLKDYPGAVDQCRLALALEPGARTARLRLLRALTSAGDLKEVPALAAGLVDDFPDDLTTHYRYAELLTRFRDHEGARRIWARLKQLNPGDPRAKMAWITESYQAEDYAGALAAAHSLAEARPAPEAALLFLAQDALNREDFQTSTRWYRRLVEENPKRPAYWEKLVESLGRLQADQEQLLAAQEAIRQNPGNTDLNLMFAESLLGVGRKEEGTALFLHYMDSPGNRPAFRGLFAGLMDCGLFAQAYRLLNGRLHPSYLNDQELVMWKAAALEGKGDLLGARALLQGLARPGADTRYVPVLLYHGIQDQAFSQDIPSTVFERHIAALAQAGFTSLTMVELAEITAGRRPWPRRPILITFDDARTDSFAGADPVLRRHGFKATMFVPTAEPSARNDFFHASWQTIRREHDSGLWDIQGHGDLAHRLIQVDAAGNMGRFLGERAFRQDLGRIETLDEFRERLDQDYARCRRRLLEEVPGSTPLGFAFPFNEAGQLNVGNAGDASSINEEIWHRYFHVGMVQDIDGYNAVRTGERGNRLIWRFDPPRTWSGEDLVAYLERQAPENQGRFLLARLDLQDNLPGRARAALATLERDAPGCRPECERTLAELSWGEGHPREAAAHFEAYQFGLAQASQTPPRVPHPLSFLLPWEMAPVLSLGSSDLMGSDHRSSYNQFLLLRYPCQAPVDLTLQAGAIRYTESGFQALKGTELKAAATWSPVPWLQGSGWAGCQDLDGLARQGLGGAALRWTRNGHDLKLSANHTGLDTVTALQAGLHQTDRDLDYRIRLGRWSASTTDSRSAISDGNRITYTSGQVLYQPLTHPNWSLGPDYEGGDSQTHSDSYYTPIDYRAIRARVQYQYSFPQGSSLTLLGAGGLFDDWLNHQRWTGIMETDWTQMWTRSARTGFRLSVGSKAGYRSTKVDFTASWRF